MRDCYLDANILVYYKNEDSPFFEKATFIIQGLLKNDYRLFISPLTLDEFLYAFKMLFTQKKIPQQKVFRELKRGLREILSLPSLTLVGPPPTISAQLRIIDLMQAFSLQPRDAYHLFIMQEHHLRFFATFDNDFVKVFQEKIVLPVSL